MLNEVATFEHRDLRRLWANAHRHHVTADWSTLTFATLPSFESLIIEFGTVAPKDRFNRTRNCALLLLLTLGLILLARLVLLARLTLLCVLALLLATTAATASTASTPTISARAPSTWMRGRVQRRRT
jgi:hypothetical protein